MKDYKLIRHIAKLTGAKPKRDKGSLFCYFPFNETCIIPVLFTFEKGNSQYAFFDLTNVYETYGKDKYPSYEKFVNAFVTKNSFYKADTVSGNLYVISNLNVNKIQHETSQALTNVSVIISVLGEMLNLKVKTYTEENWKNLYISFLANQKRNSLIGSICSIGVFAVGITDLVLLNNNGGAEGFLAFLAILLLFAIPAGIVGIIYFCLKHRYYKSRLINSIKEMK